MNYKNIYNQIIDKRKIEELSDYSEVHHIIPKSLGGSNDKDNLVKLTAREHFICHYLLAKIYEKDSIEWYKMNYAFMMMKCVNIFQNRYFNSRLYEALRINFSSIMSFAQTGKSNSQYGTMWICNVELQENRKIKKEDDIPSGWIKGRNRWNKKSVDDIEYRKRLFIQQQKKRAENLYTLYIQSGYDSLTDFIKYTDYWAYSLSALTQLFVKYLDGYIQCPGIKHAPKALK